ncbi:MAG: hypothetical protein J0L54_10015 [Chitinophagales bacterium]|nr:hypothetical protein [Chitinophagales bacterium]
MKANHLRVLSLFFFAILFSTTSFSQFFDRSRGKNVMKVVESKVIVHANQSPAFNERMKKAFADYWKVSPYEMYDLTKTYERGSNESLAAFMPGIVGLTVRGHETSMNHPFFIYGEARKDGTVGDDVFIGVFPVNGFHYEFDPKAKYYYDRALLRIPYMVYNLNDMLTYLKTKENEKGYDDYVAAKTARLAKKTLIIPKDLVAEWDVNPATTALMKGRVEAGQKDMKEIKASVLDEGDISYGGKFRIMSNEEILKLEQSADASNYALFLPAINHHKYIMVFDLSTKELLYFETVTMGMRVKEKDFDKLNKAIGF